MTFVEIKIDDQKVKVLDKGFVQLLDVSPRIVPSGYTAEYAIVEAARVSYMGETKSPIQDASLISYLYRHRHTSPFEQVSFRWRLKVPRFVATQILRHRTAKPNERSQRYTPNFEHEFYKPSTIENGIRSENVVNKQSSIYLTSEAQKDLVKHAEEKSEEMFILYDQMIKLGIAKEVARGFLPLSTYTEMIITFDLNNVLKFFSLRCDENTQFETREVAKQMLESIKDLIPTTYKCFINQSEGIFLTREDLKRKRGDNFDHTAGEGREYVEKMKKF